MPERKRYAQRYVILRTHTRKTQTIIDAEQGESIEDIRKRAQGPLKGEIIISDDTQAEVKPL